MSIAIKGATAPKIGFASHQNAIPVLRELEIVNEGPDNLEDLALNLTADPPFIQPKHWPLDRLSAGSTVHVNDRDLKLNGGFLGDLSESMRGEIRLRLTKGEEEIAASDFPLELLARAEWGGSGSMAELLPAFVTPNDPAVDQLLKATSDVLRRAGKPDAIDGYQSGSRTRVWQLVSAMWSAIAGTNISYALPPASFEKEGQKVRTPSAILDGKVATCLDTALLFAALIEQAGLNPLVIMTSGHAFVGVWLQPQEFSSLITDDAGAVRKRFDLDELLLFETTLVTKSPAPRFDMAVAEGRRQVDEKNASGFVMAVDVRRARMQRIQPLAVARGPRAGDATDKPLVSEALLDAPQLPDFDVEAEEEALTPADRVKLWQRKLLDLTTRNRLLHLPDNAKIVPLVCPEPARLEDELARGRKIKVTAMPNLEAGGRDEALYREQTQSSLKEEYAQAALERGEVVSGLDKVKLDANLIELYRKARSDLEEGGANTLFLALGFLKWRKSPDDPKQYRAPLILLPVRLERKSALSGVSLTAHEDEPRFNLTLLELLRQDFELKIPTLEGALPTDQSGVDVPKVWNIVRRAVRDLAGFEVVEDVAIGTFSFAKYLMWKDLVDRADQLKQSSVVRHLMERGAEPFECEGDFPRPEELDRNLDPAMLFAPLPADSSQISAVIASGNGCDFVLDGPPGTGKSQTIANMIAHNLALGRRVLFVAEKRAALDVVYRRLEEKQLGDFCLELHSNKAAKVDVIRQLERAWDARDTLTNEEWAREAAEVRRLRDSLNDLVQLLHARHSNGLTLHQAIGRVVRDADEATPRLHWPDGTAHDEATLNSLRDLARRLGLARAAVAGVPSEFEEIRRSHWSNGWQDRLATAAAALPPRVTSLLEARDRLCEATHLDIHGEDDKTVTALGELVALILKTYSQDLRFAFAPDFQTKAEALKRGAALVASYREAERALSVSFPPESARRLEIAAFETELARANSRFWFLKAWARKRLAREIRDQAGGADLLNLDADLPKLKDMKQLLTGIDRIDGTASGLPGWTGSTSDPSKLSNVAELAERLRACMASLAATPDQLIALRAQVAALVVDANELLAPDGAIALAQARLAAEIPASQEAARTLSQAAERGAEQDSWGYERQIALAKAIIERQPRLQAWCNWHRLREEALAAGLKPIADAIRPEAPPARAAELFEIAYARWFAGQAIDAEPRLGDLITQVHEDDIAAYRRLEDKLAGLASRYIRAQLCGRIPDKNEVGKKDGYGILKHQLQLQRRHKPVRQLAAEMGEAFTSLAPCMLMSPLSIAQYLPPDQALFDLVIFDEASQITPWDAIGSIARGRQVVIAGDPRQMPPTSFFNRGAGASEDDEATEEDMESILDECLAAGVPQHSLAWHYRSRHESLIAFSNSRYYDNRLITFPPPQTRESAVSWRKVDGVYAKGGARTNQVEAEAIVEECVRRLRDPAFGGACRTLAVVTLNSDQQKLVEDLLDQARRRHPQIERFFSEDMSEPVVVKNLETVQGDERDLILLGIGYGPTEPGAPIMSMNFGPLNREGGWRRLNVAVTRAREEMMLFTSFDAAMIDLNRTSARAVRDLKHFIEFAERGPRALAEAVQGSLGPHESPFEDAVAAALRRKGWEVVPQIGVSRFRIDLGIVHPDRPGDYLVGVECDGAAYHSAATARDRDKVRAAILEQLGWSLVRVWSTDWWVDKEGATERLHGAIRALLDLSRQTDAPPEPKNIPEPETPETPETPDMPIPQIEPARVTRPPHAIQTTASADVNELLPELIARPPQQDPLFASASYRASDLTLFAPLINPGAFYDPSYNKVLTAMMTHVIEQEAPISETLLVNRIARAHSFQRSGRLIRERIMNIAGKQFRTVHVPEHGTFVWPSEETRRSWSVFRLPVGEEHVRQIEEIAPEELRAASYACRTSSPEVEVARMFGVRRLSNTARDQISRALA